MAHPQARSSAVDVTSTNDSYQHQPLPENSTYFRLAALYPSSQFDAPLNCSLTTYAVGHGPPYKALSYVCGEATDTEILFVDGKPLAVYRNLDVALRYLRHASDALTLWIDVLCIHQKDNMEKAKQVRLMSTIYRTAQEVYGFVGPEDKTLDTAFRTLTILAQDENVMLQKRLVDLAEQYKSTHGDERLAARLQASTVRLQASTIAARLRRTLATADLPMAFPIPMRDIFFSRRQSFVGAKPVNIFKIIGESHSTSILELLARPFFTRLWIYEEMLLAKKATFLAGSNRYDADRILSSIRLMLYHAGIDSISSAGNWSSIVAWNLLVEVTFAKEREEVPQMIQNSLATGSSGLLSLVLSFWEAECRDPRDRIYALLGVASDSLARPIYPDYTLTLDETMCRFTGSYIQVEQNLHILNFCYSKHISTRPSWTLVDFDWALSILDIRHLSQPLTRIYNACREYLPRVIHEGVNNERPILQVSGFHLDTVETSLHFPGSRGSSSTGAAVDEWRNLSRRTSLSDLDFWLTLTLGQSRLEVPEPDIWESLVTTLRKAIESKADFFPSVVLKQAFWRISERAFFTTKNGRIGIGNRNMRTGDQVCILFGGCLPFILRESDDGKHHRIVGDCYIRDIAMGEAMDEFEAGVYQEKAFRLV